MVEVEGSGVAAGARRASFSEPSGAGRAVVETRETAVANASYWRFF